ncbi:MAG: SufD family Fe-S cluster assembly protein [Cardiobacteriaceae bacterium]|nr:SufD family Fe-S cluster assembly protein [Cardiobacteriaceae bacterium]
MSELFDFAAIKNREDWRWTEDKFFAELYDLPKRRIVSASFQIDGDENLEFLEDFTDLSAKEQSAFQYLEKIAAENPIANWNLQENLNDTLRFRITESQAEPITIYCDRQAERFLEFSRIEITVAPNVKTAINLDFSAENSACQIPLIELFLEENSDAEILLITKNSSQENAKKAAQILNFFIYQEKKSNLRCNLFGAGDFFRADISAYLQGEEANFLIATVQKNQPNTACNTHIRVEHNAEHCQSKQILRGVIEANSQAIFAGTIYVAKGAQKTDAEQNSRYLLLDDSAKTLAIPQLEIYADDVKCAHGATSGQIDEQAMFYLQSRGINQDDARQMLINAFLQEASVLENPSLQEIWQELL